MPLMSILRALLFSGEKTYPRELLTLVRFKQLCLRELNARGWTVNLEGFTYQCRIEKDNIRARLFFIAPTEELTVTMRYDLLASRARTSEFVIIVLYDLQNVAVMDMIRESNFLYCAYPDLPKLEDYCRYTMIEFSRCREDGLFGVVDGFIAPSTLKGWVRLRQDGTLINGLTIVIFKNGKEIARAEPDHLRLDVCESSEYLAGFKVVMQDGATADDLLSHSLSIVAKDAMGRSYPIPIWRGLEAALKTSSN